MSHCHICQQHELLYQSDNNMQIGHSYVLHEIYTILKMHCIIYYGFADMHLNTCSPITLSLYVDITATGETCVLIQTELQLGLDKKCIYVTQRHYDTMSHYDIGVDTGVMETQFTWFKRSVPFACLCLRRALASCRVHKTILYVCVDHT